jgi:protein-tyrosine phosphatase
VLFVCRANLCRSPMAETLARMAGVRCASAGTRARLGEPMYAGAATVLRELGATVDDFRSRPLTAELVQGADLVLTATREQRGVCVRLAPSALRRTFTIRQFGRLATALGRSDGDVLEAVAKVQLQPVPPHDDDIPDPIPATEAEIRACLRSIQDALRPALRLISPTS